MTLEYCETSCSEPTLKQFCGKDHSRKCSRCKNASFRRKIMNIFGGRSNEKLCQDCCGWVPPEHPPMTGAYCRSRCSVKLRPVLDELGLGGLQNFCRQSRDCERCRDETWRKRIATTPLSDGCAYCCGFTGANF